ncbi:MAG: hypothetical protein WD773_02790 [Gemmatimonadales bacterium]
MAISLSSVVLAVTLVQAPAPPPADSLRAALWARVAADSTDGPAWLELGRLYLQRGAEYHAHKTPAPRDTTWAQAILDTAQQAFGRAARWSAGTRTADSARVFHVYAVGERAYLDWESGGPEAAILAWHTLPEGLRLPPVLEELGENLLRACPHNGILLTANEHDTQAAWYLRFARGLRADLVIMPFDRWRGDTVMRGRVMRDFKARDRALRALGRTRAVCASMGFERPPEERSLRWAKRPLVWVTGKETRADRVPAHDFVFAALRLAVDQHETWSPPAVALYRRAVSMVPALCKPFDTFGLKSEVGCR